MTGVVILGWDEQDVLGVEGHGVVILFGLGVLGIKVFEILADYPRAYIVGITRLCG